MRSGSEASVVDALVRDTRLNGAVAEASALAARGSSVREAMLASPPRRALMVEAAPPPLPQPRAGANALEVVITVCATEALVDGTALKVVECAAEQLVDDAHAVVCSSAGALGLAGALRAELRARSCRMAQPLGKKRKLCVACLRPIVRAICELDVAAPLARRVRAQVRARVAPALRADWQHSAAARVRVR